MPNYSNPTFFVFVCSYCNHSPSQCHLTPCTTVKVTRTISHGTLILSIVTIINANSVYRLHCVAKAMSITAPILLTHKMNLLKIRTLTFVSPPLTRVSFDRRNCTFWLHYFPPGRQHCQDGIHISINKDSLTII